MLDDKSQASEVTYAKQETASKLPEVDRAMMIQNRVYLLRRMLIE